MANRCEIYTPIKVVKKMLNLVDYKGSKILDKHVIDNSFGKEAFLLEIVNIYIREYLKIDSVIAKLFEIATKSGNGTGYPDFIYYNKDKIYW